MGKDGPRDTQVSPLTFRVQRTSNGDELFDVNRTNSDSGPRTSQTGITKGSSPGAHSLHPLNQQDNFFNT